MGGSIDVISTPGLGSRFEVRLPLIDAIRRPAHPSCAHRPGRLPVSGIHPIVADLIARGHRASAIDAPPPHRPPPT
jgi:hypothetical protein